MVVPEAVEEEEASMWRREKRKVTKWKQSHSGTEVRILMWHYTE